MECASLCATGARNYFKSGMHYELRCTGGELLSKPHDDFVLYRVLMQLEKEEKSILRYHYSSYQDFLVRSSSVDFHLTLIIPLRTITLSRINHSFCPWHTPPIGKPAWTGDYPTAPYPHPRLLHLPRVPISVHYASMHTTSSQLRTHSPGDTPSSSGPNGLSERSWTFGSGERVQGCM